MSDNPDLVTVERVIPSSPQVIFDLLADPSRHREIDGSGAVRDPRGPVDRLQLGSHFGMSMKMGLPYSMDSRVVEFEEPKLIAWQTTGPTRFGRHVGGRLWRYELEEVDGGTRVRETWDISQESAFTKPIVRLARSKTEQNMTATLERIEQKVTDPS
jgi:uncharacterized protein YndB with AHSA1/START domain